MTFDVDDTLAPSPFDKPQTQDEPKVKKKKKAKKLKHARSKAEVVRTITGCLSLLLQCYVAYRVTTR